MRVLYLFGLALTVAGCDVANTEKNFLCGAQEGQPCSSLSEVDGSTGLSGTTVNERPEDTLSSDLSQSPLLNAKGSSATGLSLGDGGEPYQSSRYRIPEKTGRLWLAPRLDDENVLHEATFAHFVLREATWGNR